MSAMNINELWINCLSEIELNISKANFTFGPFNGYSGVYLRTLEIPVHSDMFFTNSTGNFEHGDSFIFQP